MVAERVRSSAAKTHQACNPRIRRARRATLLFRWEGSCCKSRSSYYCRSSSHRRLSLEEAIQAARITPTRRGQRPFKCGATSGNTGRRCGRTTAGHQASNFESETQRSLPSALTFLTRGVLGPFGGTGVANLGEDIQGGNYSGAAGDALGTFINAMMLRKGSAPSAAKATNRLTFAAGKEAHLPIERTLPELREAASAGAKPETMDDFRSVTKAANSTVKREADAAMSSIALRQVLPTSIAQKIRDLIKPDMIKTTEGKAEIAHINAAAKVYEKPWTFAELDSKRMRLNADLSTFEKKTPIARYTAKAGNLNTAIDKVVADTIRDVIYPQMDQAAGRPPGYFRALKQKQGNLMQLDSQLAGRTKELKAQTAEVQGASRFNRENASIHMGGSGVPRASLYGLMNVIKKRNPLKSANKRVGMGFETGSPAAKAYTRTLPFRSTLFPQNEQEQR